MVITICSTQWLCQLHLTRMYHWLSSQEIENCSESPILTPGPRQSWSLYKIGLWGFTDILLPLQDVHVTQNPRLYSLLAAAQIMRCCKFQLTTKTWTKLSGGGSCILHLVQSLTWSCYWWASCVLLELNLILVISIFATWPPVECRQGECN